MPPKRTYNAGHFALVLDGEETTLLNSVTGGDIWAEVITSSPRGTGESPPKHIGSPHYDPIVMTVGMSMGKGLQEWIQAFLAGSATRKNGAIIAADFDYKEQRQITFHNAIITSITFPALDGSSKDAAYLTITIQPEYIVASPGSGQQLKASLSKAKNWRVSNFTFKLANLPCDRVSQISSLIVKSSLTEEDLGIVREPVRYPGRLEFPDIVITLAAVDLAQWEAWFESFVIKGHNSQGEELSGSITYLSPNLKTELGQVQLDHVGIYALTTFPVSGGQNTIDRYQAKLYCNDLKFEMKLN